MEIPSEMEPIVKRLLVDVEKEIELLENSETEAKARKTRQDDIRAKKYRERRIKLIHDKEYFIKANSTNQLIFYSFISKEAWLSHALSIIIFSLSLHHLYSFYWNLDAKNYNSSILLIQFFGFQFAWLLLKKYIDKYMMPYSYNKIVIGHFIYAIGVAGMLLSAFFSKLTILNFILLMLSLYLSLWHVIKVMIYFFVNVFTKLDLTNKLSLLVSFLGLIISLIALFN